MFSDEFMRFLINYQKPEEPKKIYIPRMIHPWKRQSFEKFAEKQFFKLQKELEEKAS